MILVIQFSLSWNLDHYVPRSTLSSEIRLKVHLVCVSNSYISCSISNDNRTAALRASLGHPEPFTLHYVEVGNEVSSPRSLLVVELI